MSKRASGRFPRQERDFYPTPPQAVLPLLPFLHGVRSFCDPCCGDHDLVRHLKASGLTCGYAGDLANGQNALAIDDFGGLPVITNPPWERATLHRMIDHFIAHAPFVWLLLELDWSATKQAKPYMRYCTDIVIIGRVRWIAGSRSTGFDNCAWFRFKADHVGGPVLHTEPPPEVGLRRAATCPRCGAAFQSGRSDRRFCSASCRQAAYRARKAVTGAVTGPKAEAAE